MKLEIGVSAYLNGERISLGSIPPERLKALEPEGEDYDNIKKTTTFHWRDRDGLNVYGTFYPPHDLERLVWEDIEAAHREEIAGEAELIRMATVGKGKEGDDARAELSDLAESRELLAESLPVLTEEEQREAYLAQRIAAAVVRNP